MVLDIAEFRVDEGGDPEKMKKLQKDRYKVFLSTFFFNFFIFLKSKFIFLFLKLLFAIIFFS